MSVNHYFNNTNARNEQNVVEDLTIEVIKIYGMDVYFLPRTLVNADRLFGEDPISKFITSKPIEMYLETVNGFEGQGDLLSKFGLQVKDSASLVVSKKRFQKETGMERPLEGDIIYLPLTKGLFEIKFVEHENPFYPNGKNHTFKLNVELFQFSEETFNTGETAIDTIAVDYSFDTYITYGITSGTGSFVVGDNVYQYTNGTITGGSANANATGIIQEISSSQYTLQKVTGKWEASDSTQTRYITKFNNTAYRTVTSIDDSINTDTYDDNKPVQDTSDGLLDFSVKNPFGTP